MRAPRMMHLVFYFRTKLRLWILRLIFNFLRLWAWLWLKDRMKALLHQHCHLWITIKRIFHKHAEFLYLLRNFWFLLPWARSRWVWMLLLWSLTCRLNLLCCQILRFRSFMVSLILPFSSWRLAHRGLMAISLHLWKELRYIRTFNMLLLRSRLVRIKSSFWIRLWYFKRRRLMLSSWNVKIWKLVTSYWSLCSFKVFLG